LKITILGCGTSTGVPVIGCTCKVCLSQEQKNKRTRSSVLVQAGGKNILIDTSTDLRQQSLAHNINRIDAVLYTHPHADHIHGIDELRSFNMAQNSAIPCYGNSDTIRRIKQIFHYIFTDNANESWKPDLRAHIVNGPFNIFGLNILPIEVHHGKIRVFGYRIGNFAYVTDCSYIPDEANVLLHKLDLLILGVLREKPHPTHLNISQALDLIKDLKPKRTIFTHLSHNVDYIETTKKLSDNIELGYDGMEINVP